MRSNRLTLAIGLSLTIGLAACSPKSTTLQDSDDQRAQQSGERRDEPAIQEERKVLASTQATPGQDRSKDKEDAIEVTGSRLGRGQPQAPAEPDKASPLSSPAPMVMPAPKPQSIVATDASTSLGKTKPESAANGAMAMKRAPAESAALPNVVLQTQPPANTEKYQDHADNPVKLTANDPVSTFSIDVDTGSYTNVRRMLNAQQLPPADSVRAEEFLNYFDYGYTPPTDRAQPFSVTTELAAAPWNPQRKLMLVGIKGYELPRADIPPSNLVFLIDTSGSMDSPDKLPLLRDAFKQMVPNLRAQDRVSIVVYAGSAGLVLQPTPGDQHQRILEALDGLSAGGSTNGGAGIQLAYAMAKQAYIAGGVNRVVLATDGDFNVGTTDNEALKTLVSTQREGGVALTTLGFGQGNYNEELAEQLADIGNGNHAYIDSLAEARKVLVNEAGSTLFTIAKDVKIQIEFNPRAVAEYRLIGYENRQLRREDFNNDKIDAGEIGAGHDVTALYELTLVGDAGAQVDPLRYAGDKPANSINAEELAFVKLRYKQPDQSVSRLIERPVRRSELQATASERLRFAAAVTAFADALRGGSHLGNYDLPAVAALARSARGNDHDGYRAEFVQLVEQAYALRPQTPDKQVAISH